jgi:hypothetical protein
VFSLDLLSELSWQHRMVCEVLSSSAWKWLRWIVISTTISLSINVKKLQVNISGLGLFFVRKALITDSAPYY